MGKYIYLPMQLRPLMVVIWNILSWIENSIALGIADNILAGVDFLSFSILLSVAKSKVNAMQISLRPNHGITLILVSKPMFPGQEIHVNYETMSILQTRNIQSANCK